MKKFAALLLLLALAPAPALAQSSCAAIAYGAVLTAAQWQQCFTSKQDYLGAAPLLTTGGTMTGEIVTAPSTTASAGLNLPPGAAPTSPFNGDMWTTSAGAFVRINGVTYQFDTATSASFAATAPLAVTFPGAVVTYALNFNSSLANSGGNLAVNPANTNTFTVPEIVDLGTGAEPTAGGNNSWETYGGNGVPAREEITAFNNSVSGATAVFDGRTSLGTRASPSAVTAGTMLASFEGKGYDASAWTGTGAAFHALAEGTFSSSSHPGEGCIATTATGGTSTTDQFCVHQDGGATLGSATGGDEGTGKINVSGGYYLNGALPAITVNSVSCPLTGSCTITAATSLQVGATTISSGTNGRVEFNNSGTLGEYTITGTAGSVVMSSGPTIAGETVSGTANFTGTFEIGGNAMTFPATTATIASLNNTNQTVTGGANTTPPNLGTFSSGTLTVNCGVGPIQYLTNGGSFTMAAPSNPGSCDLWVFNNASAGSISLSGFNSLTNSGEIPDTVNGHLFIYHVEQANSQSIAVVKAGQ